MPQTLLTARFPANAILLIKTLIVTACYVAIENCKNIKLKLIYKQKYVYENMLIKTTSQYQ